jgi:hypothetical protein
MTTRTERTDIHRPSAEEFDPQAYEYSGCFDLHPEPGDFHSVQERIRVVNHWLEQGYRFTSESGGTCGHCGAACRYVALMTHPATKGMIYIGETCLDNRFDLTKGEFQTLRKNASLNRERRKKADRIAEIVNAMRPEVKAAYDWAKSYHDSTGYELIGEGPAAYYGGKAWDDCTPAEKAARKNKGWQTAADIAGKIAQYVAPLSEKQENFLVLLHTREQEAEARKAAEAAKVESGEVKPCPEGRVKIIGTILSVKWVDNDFGGTYKMTVKSDEGFRVYGSAPSSLESTERGVRVEFTARCEPSQDDKAFGFFSRPTKAKNL